MHRFVTYDKDSGEILGHFAVSNPEYIPRPLSPQHEFAPVVEPEQLQALDQIDPERQLPAGKVKNGKLESFAIRSRYRGRLVLTTDLPDLDGDGTAELPADGRAMARITVRAVDEAGKELRDTLPEVKIQTTRGTISRRMIKLEGGTAEVELRAAPETTSVRITATAKDFEPAALVLEVIPEQEYQELKGRK